MLVKQSIGVVPRDRDHSHDRATKNVALVTGGSRGLGAELVSIRCGDLEPDENSIHRAVAAYSAEKDLLLVSSGCARWPGIAPLRNEYR